MTETKTAAAKAKKSDIWTDEEKAAMQEHAKDQKRRSDAEGFEALFSDLPPTKATEADGLADLLAKIAEMPDADRLIAERIHAIVTKVAPGLAPRTYYGMPAYAKDGKVICFFQAKAKFKVRYATLGFQPDAKLDDGQMWPTSWAITKLTAADEERIAELVKRSVS